MPSSGNARTNLSHEDHVSTAHGNQSNRCVLLFDMDCFYAQCERVRLGLPLDVKLCLFQWNSVLAVTYPAREHGIKRGDSWDDVAAKVKKNIPHKNSNSDSKNHARNQIGCYTIHLPIIGKATARSPSESEADCARDGNTGDDGSIETSYRKMFELSREEQLRCQRTENGTRRFHDQGKACLERYRIASMRIFGVVLESLQKRITQRNGYSFVLERASIDEFYLDLTDYCYCRNRKKECEGIEDSLGNRQEDDIINKHDKGDGTGMNKTVVAGQKTEMGEHCSNNGGTCNRLEIALNRACQVSHWIREDVWNTLGFTMSAGISINKTMAKLAASYGKPNGQAVLFPCYFSSVLSETKITKVRNFGGKLGKAVLRVLLDYQAQERQLWHSASESESDMLEALKSTATMADLSQVPLTFLLQSKLLSNESARFVFSASQGIEHEAVKNTSGALVKSITAFKSFSATKSHSKIFDRWLAVLATEILERVARDTARNKRYPKSCTLNYTYYTTPNGQRPSTTMPGSSTRGQRQSRSLRLRFPSEREGTPQEKSTSLLEQARTKLAPVLKDNPIRGVGLSVSNFVESFRTAPGGTGSIQSFFSIPPKNCISSSSISQFCAATETKQSTVANISSADESPSFKMHGARGASAARIRDTTMKRSHSDFVAGSSFPVSSLPASNPLPASARKQATTGRLYLPNNAKSVPVQSDRYPQEITNNEIKTIEDEDLEFARKLQASFDRENYALSTANRRRKSTTNMKKTRRIDAFFAKR